MALGRERLSFEDALAVVFAGGGEPVTRRVASQYPGGEALSPEGSERAEGEPAALIYGTAAHALDFDDVHQFSNTHPSAPIVAALVAAVRAEPELAGRATTAFAVGIAATVAASAPSVDRVAHVMLWIAGTLAALAGSRLLALHEAIKPQAERYGRVYYGAVTDAMLASVEEHALLLRAIETGDSDAAQRAVLTNWRSAAARLGEVIDRMGERGSW